MYHIYIYVYVYIHVHMHDAGDHAATVAAWSVTTGTRVTP